MGKTYRFRPARAKMAKGMASEEVERTLRGKGWKRREINKKREEEKQWNEE